MNRLLTPTSFVVLLVGLLLAGCTSNSRIIATGLNVELTAIEPQANGTAQVSWQVANSNIVSYLLSEVDLKLTVNGRNFGTIKERAPLAVPPTSKAGRTSVVTLTPEAAQWLAGANQQTVAYEVATKITILIYGDTTEDSKLQDRGMVTIGRAAGAK